MYKFVLPFVIDRRRAVLVDLVDERELPDTASRHFDSYVVEFPQISNELVRVSTLQLLQSLSPDRDDVPLEDLVLSLAVSDAAIGRFRLEMRQAVAGGDLPMGLVDIAPGLSLVLHAESGAHTIELRREPGYRGARRESIELEVCYMAEDGKRFLGLLDIHAVEPSQILRAGLDFGSEASQLRFARGDQYETRTFDLLESIRVRHFPDRDGERETFVQDETGNRYLYRSVFFARKTLSDSAEDLDLVTPRDRAEEEGGEFLEGHHKIPNLKLLGLEDDLGADIIFDGPDGRETSLLEMRDDIYNRLVERMLTAFLMQCDDVRDRCLRFTILVPNIYDIGRVAKARRLVAEIIGAEKRLWHPRGKAAFEIDVLSESDASFLGYAAMGNVNFATDSYTIVIDCGKGTTDFSVILTNADRSMRSVYRNGFAGAGNLISFAFFQTLVGFLDRLAESWRDTNPSRHGRIRSFIDDHILSEKSNFRYKAYEHVERWKKSYGTGIAQAGSDVSAHWMSAREGSYSLENVFDDGSPGMVARNLNSLLGKIERVHDWDGHVRRATEFIADTTRKRLEWVIRKLNRRHACGGILLTGRGFLFTPLASRMNVVLSGMDGLSKGGLLDTAGVNLKEVCMQGVFHSRFVTHSDVVCTPMEVTEKDRDKAIRRSDVAGKSLLKRIANWVNFLLGLDGTHLYEETSNSFPIEQKNLMDARFRMGETIFLSNRGGQVEAEEARLVISRSGLHIVATDKSGRKHIVELKPAPKRSNPEMQPVIRKSLFPVFFFPGLVYA